MAADQDHGRAENALGSLYYRGLGVPSDANMAVSLFRKAASKVNILIIKINHAILYKLNQGKPTCSKQSRYLL
jgi:TPR repeat protein